MRPVAQKIVEVKDVAFAYGDQQVLDQVTLDIWQGDYVGILGPNGGGKSTLLKIMLGLLKPQSGSVKLFGQELHRFKDWSKIGYVPQKATSFDIGFPATVEEVVSMGRFGKRGLLRGLTNEDRQKVRQAMAKVEIEDLSKRLISNLSGGQQQRVFIARALSSDPEMIILDEPTAGVDEATQNEFYSLLRTLNQDHTLTLVLVSHDSAIIEREAHEIVEINRTLRRIRIKSHA